MLFTYISIPSHSGNSAAVGNRTSTSESEETDGEIRPIGTDSEQVHRSAPKTKNVQGHRALSKMYLSI